MFGMHLSGALGRAIIPDLAIPDQVIPTLMLKVLPPIIAGIFLAAQCRQLCPPLTHNSFNLRRFLSKICIYPQNPK